MCFWPDNLLLASHEHNGHFNSTSTNEELILSRVKPRLNKCLLVEKEVLVVEQVVVEWTIS